MSWIVIPRKDGATGEYHIKVKRVGPLLVNKVLGVVAFRDKGHKLTCYASIPGHDSTQARYER